MSVLRSIESKLESLFEGVFGRAFRANVQPVELARKLVKEMDDHRNVSVSRVYVPNEYTIYLSPADREQFSNYEAQLRDELQDYLAEHARRESYALLISPPKVKFETDDDLEIGVFGIATRLVQPGRGRRSPTSRRAQAAPGATMIYTPYRPAARRRPSCLPSTRSPARGGVLAWRATARDHAAAGRARPLEGLRHPGHRSERVAPSCRGAARTARLHARRPRLDERRSRSTAARQAAEARGRHAVHDRLDRDQVLPEPS